MKLSWKFCIIAYLVVLLSTGFGGAFLVQHANNKVWEAQVNRIIVSSDYAVNSLYSFSELSYEEFTLEKRKSFIEQNKYMLDSCITEFSILPFESLTEPIYLNLKPNCGIQRFFEEQDKLFMESACMVEASSSRYLVSLKSDFSDLQQYRSSLCIIYALTTLAISIICGFLLYHFTNKVTKPLNILKNTVNELSLGNYGKTVDIRTSDLEIADLANSFNSMSKATEHALLEIQNEVHKREMFIANFTHEIKTPVTAIIGYADLLRSYNLSEDEMIQASTTIYKEGQRLERLSKELLNLFVIQNSKIATTRIALKEIESTLHETLQMLSRKYQMNYELDFPDMEVIANPSLLLSMLFNLSDNAFKASKKGDSIQIFTDTKTARHGRICIIVKDHGCGIPPKHLKHLTDAFYRIDAARSRKRGGSGIGLSLCEEIAKCHHSTLTFTSTPRVGTTVSFELIIAGDIYE